MKRSPAFLAVVALVAVASTVSVVPVLAQEGGTTDEQMEMMMKAAQPGEHHKHLEALTGEFVFSNKMWMAPGADPIVNEGTSSSKMILGGRYVQDHIEGEFMGMPFVGVGTTGYDNLAQQYVHFWIDNMGTGMLSATGKCSNGGKTFTLHGKMPNPEMGGTLDFTQILEVVDDDTHVLTWLANMPDGSQFKMMEMTLKRKK